MQLFIIHFETSYCFFNCLCIRYPSSLWTSCRCTCSILRRLTGIDINVYLLFKDRQQENSIKQNLQHLAYHRNTGKPTLWTDNLYIYFISLLYTVFIKIMYIFFLFHSCVPLYVSLSLSNKIPIKYHCACGHHVKKFGKIQGIHLPMFSY